jgi:hypothetical protein
MVALASRCGTCSTKIMRFLLRLQLRNTAANNSKIVYGILHLILYDFSEAEPHHFSCWSRSCIMVYSLILHHIS